MFPSTDSATASTASVASTYHQNSALSSRWFVLAAAPLCPTWRLSLYFSTIPKSPPESARNRFTPVGIDRGQFFAAISPADVEKTLEGNWNVCALVDSASDRQPLFAGAHDFDRNPFFPRRPQIDETSHFIVAGVVPMPPISCVVWSRNGSQTGSTGRLLAMLSKADVKTAHGPSRSGGR